jgi:hypothetical protein
MRRLLVPAVALFASGLFAIAAEDNAIKAAMKYANKAPKDVKKVCEKIVAGTASDEEIKKTLELYKAMRDVKPPKGDAAEFTAKTDKAIAALEDVVAKKDGAADAFKKANNCKACHDPHKAD